MELEHTILTFFLTKNFSLKTWADMGIIDRELVIYRKLSNYLEKVNIVTYGGRKDKRYSNKLGGIKLLPVKWHNRAKITVLHLLIKHYSEIKNSDILKTNQIQGSEIALWFKKKFRKKLIVRCGYLYSQFILQQTEDEAKRRKAYKLERDAFLSADIGVVSSQRDHDYILAEYDLMPEKIKVVPNYVLTDVFKPLSGLQIKYDLVYIGRSGSQKNVINLLRAINYLSTEKRNVSLLMVGSCCYDSTIKQLIGDYGLEVTLKGIVPHFELPHLLNQAQIFIIPSHYEGHPKTLLEAMSCALPCIGSDVPGIRDDIDHLRTGYLCQTNFKSIANAIETLLADESLQAKLGSSARKYILANYSLDKILRQELDVIKEVLAS